MLNVGFVGSFATLEFRVIRSFVHLLKSLCGFQGRYVTWLTCCITSTERVRAPSTGRLTCASEHRSMAHEAARPIFVKNVLLIDVAHDHKRP